MNDRKLHLLVTARQEASEAFDWYYERSPRAAARFLGEIDTAVILIRESPAAWPPFEGGTRRYVFSGFPYSVIYREVGHSLQVIAVAHHKRRPAYWQSRPDA